MSTKSRKELSPEEYMKKSDHIAQVEAEVLETAAGAVAGAVVGAMGGPIGAAAGAAIGAAIGAAVGFRQKEVEHKASLHDRDLDAIGVVPPSNQEFAEKRGSTPPPPPAEPETEEVTAKNAKA